MPLTNAQKQQALRKRRADAGLVTLTVYVPQYRAGELKQIAADMVAEHMPDDQPNVSDES